MGYGAAQVFKATGGDESVWKQERMLSNAPPDDATNPPGGVLPRSIPSIQGLVELPLDPDGRRPLLMFVSRTNAEWYVIFRLYRIDDETETVHMIIKVSYICARYRIYV